MLLFIYIKSDLRLAMICGDHLLLPHHIKTEHVNLISRMQNINNRAIVFQLKQFVRLFIVTLIFIYVRMCVPIELCKQALIDYALIAILS